MLRYSSFVTYSQWSLDRDPQTHKNYFLSPGCIIRVVIPFETGAAAPRAGAAARARVWHAKPCLSPPRRTMSGMDPFGRPTYEAQARHDENRERERGYVPTWDP